MINYFQPTVSYDVFEMHAANQSMRDVISDILKLEYDFGLTVQLMSEWDG